MSGRVILPRWLNDPSSDRYCVTSVAVNLGSSSRRFSYHFVMGAGFVMSLTWNSFFMNSTELGCEINTESSVVSNCNPSPMSNSPIFENSNFFLRNFAFSSAQLVLVCLAFRAPNWCVVQVKVTYAVNL